MNDKADEVKKEDQLLRSATSWQWRKRQRTSSLGDQIQSYLSRHKRSFDKSSAVVDAWTELVPEVLQRYCRLERFERGELVVRAQPGPYMHQLKLIQSELVKELKRQCPRSGLKKIRLIAGNISSEEKSADETK